MNYPKITVITPSYDQGAYLEETIVSVLSQGYPNLEYIIIDGGSTDNSVEIISRYQEQITNWISEPDQGLYHAIQKGFDQSTGEIMTWINSDDTLSKNSLFTVAEVFNDFPNINWLSGTPNQMDESGRIIGTDTVPKWNKYRYLRFDFKYIQQEGTFWRRGLWDQSGGKMTSKFTLAGDLELWSRFFQHEQLYYIPGILGTFRMRKSNQKSLDYLEEYHREALEILSAMEASEGELQNLKMNNSLLRNLIKRSRIALFRRISGYRNAEMEINTYPPSLKYDRIKQRFVLSS
jgi:glycosyltransferase involved in cell wall biosynthesis